MDPFDSKFYMRPHGDGDVEFVSIYYEDPGGFFPPLLLFLFYFVLILLSLRFYPKMVDELGY